MRARQTAQQTAQQTVQQTAVLRGLGRGLGRACHPEPCAAVTLVAALLAVGSGRDAGGVVAVALAVGVGQLSIGWANDAVDADRDRAVGRTGKPVVAGLVSRRTVAAAAGTALLTDVPLSLLSGWRAGLVHLTAVGLAWGYDLRWKQTRASIGAYAGAFGLLPAFVTLGLPGHPWPRWWVLAAGALLGCGAHLANALPDLDDDLRLGVLGLPQRLGAARTRAGAALLLLAASAVLVLGPGDAGLAGTVALAVATGLVAGGLVAGRRPGSPAAFRVAIVLAVLDVGLLLARGSALT